MLRPCHDYWQEADACVCPFASRLELLELRLLSNYLLRIAEEQHGALKHSKSNIELQG
jgi:hypothetical protein